MDLEALQVKHRKEARDLQSRITQKKKNATKKNRRAVNAECEDLERQLYERHEKELAELQGQSTLEDERVDVLDEATDENDTVHEPTFPTINQLTDSLDKVKVSQVDNANGDPPKKRNRQKERLARRAAEQEAAAIEAEKEAAKLPNWKRMERTAMLKAFKEHELVEKEIQPDGHCLFSSVADQLSQAGIPLGVEGGDLDGLHKYKAVRKAAARYIEGHPDEFAGFLDEPLPSYVTKIRDTAEWGGQLELTALARTYNVEICVLQEGRLERITPIGDNAEDLEKLWLAYYRHGYGLGEHYNSLRRTSPGTKS